MQEPTEKRPHSKSNEPGPQPRSDISFHPLSEGLGFHPFSDGLPYAPLTPATSAPRENQLMGTGAVAAGPPSVVLPNRVIKQLIAPRSAIPLASPAKERRLDFTPEVFDLSYSMKRIGAYVLDLLLVAGLLVGSLVLLIWKQNLEQSLFSNENFLLAFFFFVLFSHWILVGVQEVLFKTSLGKAFFGLSLDGTGIRILTRAFLFLVSFGLVGLGLVGSLFDSRRRCWHDRLTGLQPGRGD